MKCSKIETKKERKRLHLKEIIWKIQKSHVVHLHTNWRKIQGCKWTKLQNKIKKQTNSYTIFLTKMTSNKTTRETYTIIRKGKKIRNMIEVDAL